MYKISQSQINLYRKCPYAYKLRYIDNRISVMFDPSIVEVGSRVHSAIDRYYKNYFDTNLTQNQILEIVYGLLRQEWDTTLPPEYLKKAFKCLYNFAIFESNNLSNDLRTKPLTEVKIQYNDLYGIVDYIDFNTKTVIDFKTNTNAGLGYDKKMQAVMYKKLVEGRFKTRISSFYFVFLYPGKQIEVKFDKKLSKIEEELEKIKNSIIGAFQKKKFPKKPRTPNTCKGCEYRIYCGGV
ncbi:MAG: PD-(D/E)XK nuclease family protein [Candidatus Heimdallarchaeaceae archaeon]